MAGDSRAVLLSEAAIDDIVAIYTYLAKRIGVGRAEAYASRIETFCMSLGEFSERGRSRADLAKDLRSATFEGRAVIVYAVRDNSVEVLRVIHGAQDYDADDFP